MCDMAHEVYESHRVHNCTGRFRRGRGSTDPTVGHTGWKTPLNLGEIVADFMVHPTIRDSS